MKKNYNECIKDEKFMNENNARKAEQSYSYYSRLLKEPFDTVEALQRAEDAYYAKLKAKEDKAAAKKADAKKVQDSFVSLNAARKVYKDELNALTIRYSEDLLAIKKSFEESRDAIRKRLVEAEDGYSAAIKEFTDKYPEGFHITLKDGDFETTISGSHQIKTHPVSSFDMFSWLFNI